ncbi:glycosyltransferase family 87 protein [Salarchaeum sp. III]|uniref:glycosyltransferase family 87 protein n=1 Tax=Salarchaeum sp. III TaxID=3107927 RepID=UPI002EDA6310
MSVIPSFALHFSDDTPVTDRVRRLVLLVCAIGGLVVPAYFLGIADVSHLAWDFRAYYTAAEAVIHGHSFVGINTGIPGVTYVYPPISVVFFLPHTAMGSWQLAFAFQTAINVCATIALAALTIRTIETYRGRLPLIDRTVITGFCLGTVPVMAVFGLGQVDMVIALALAAAFVALEHGREGIAGAALGGAALVKLFPAVLGLWLLWRRAWRALAAAVLTGISGVIVGGVLFGFEIYSEYLHVLAGRSRIAAFSETVSPNFFSMTLFRPFSQLFPHTDPHLYALFAVLAVTPILALTATRDHTVTDRVTTYLTALIAMLVVSPASNTLYVVYVYFPLLCLLHLDTGQRGRTALLVGTIAIAFPVQPAQIHAVLTTAGVSPSLTTQGFGILSEALTVVSIPLAGLLAILGWCAVRSTRTRTDPDGESQALPAD